MLQSTENAGKIEGIKICRGAPRVNHLFFADDSLILPVSVEISCHCFQRIQILENSAEEFHPHETLSIPMKLLLSLSLLIWCYISIINVHKTLIKPIETGLLRARKDDAHELKHILETREKA
jgi:hypothetical protein